jgi:hypothetical protein
MRTCARLPGLFLAAGFVVFFLLPAMVPPAAAAIAGNDATSCECKDCHITITLKVAFFGADNDYISRFIDEVQNAWNGPADNPSTCGDCKCPFEVKVVTKKVTDCTKEKEYHCIEVTNYTAKPPFSGNESVLGQVRNGTVDPKTSDQVTRYRGYLYPPGTSTGVPVNGWWSDAMSTPYNGQQVTDFAHEAGHLMGLVDKSGGIMDFSGMTSGRVSQGNIDQAVKNVCKEPNPCPDRCCCGNGAVDRTKGEGCDPLAAPSGCAKGSACCPVCCHCVVPACDPAAGEFPTEEDCRKNCSGKSDTCQMNYLTGCWDCGPAWMAGSGPYTATREAVWKANESIFHPPLTLPQTNLSSLRQTVQVTPSASATAVPVQKLPATSGPANTTPLSPLISTLNDVPVAMDFLSSERINVYLPEGEYHVTTRDGTITDSGEGSGNDPTVNVWSDEETLRQIAASELAFEKAVASDRVRFEGVGFTSSLKFTVSSLVVKIKAAFSSGD